MDEFAFELKKSKPVWLRETGQVTPCAKGGSELLVVCEDITVRRKLSEKLSFQASHDELTGLVNRREFEHRLKRVLQTAKEEGSEHALCYLDLDQFKIVNDTCGHVAGDELLRQICNLLKQCVRKRDTLARLGGDEFAILMEDCDIDRTCRVSNQIHDVTKRFRFSWDDKTFSVGVSIGIVLVDRSFVDAKEILGAADAACYEAKDKGTNRQHIYSADDADLARRHGEMQWVSKINDALDDGRFELFQQAMQPLHSGFARKRIEILLRLRGNDGALVEPADFLPAAERYDLAPKIDQWVIENTFDWIRENRMDLDDVELVCINISGRSLGDEQFTAFVESLFARGGVPAAMICFEITETAAIKHLVNATRFISVFKSRGCSFALDDFGAGLSSFAYLKNLHVDIIKIDGQFITGMEDDPVKLAIVKSINEIGKVMGKATIAEFVQTAQELKLVKKLGIDYAQGFFVARPLPLATARLG